MKKFFSIAVLVVVVLISTAAWAMQADDCGSQLLVHEGQLMELTYENVMTAKAAEMTARFKQFGWRELRDGECIPTQPDIQVHVTAKETGFAVVVNHGPDHDLLAVRKVPNRYSARRIADTILVAAKKK